MSQYSSSLTGQMPYAAALQSSQDAPQFLKRQTTARASAFVSYLSSSESSDVWTAYEQFLLTSLRTGDDKSALLCLDDLTSRFGASNERIMALRGLYQEAIAADDSALERVLDDYETILLEDPTNTPVMKRQIALLTALSRPIEAITTLVELLQNSPTDVESWAELSDLYLSQAMYSQTCFCLEEVLTIAPNAWNIHARLGEVLYMSTLASRNANDLNMEKALTEAIRRYCRSVELCDGYLRGYYGLKITTDRLLEVFHKDGKRDAPSSTAESKSQIRFPVNTINKLNEKATQKIAEIVRRNGAGDVDYRGYDKSEIAAAKDLLARSNSVQKR